jgi:AraC-like DNA-binding protein
MKHVLEEATVFRPEPCAQSHPRTTAYRGLSGNIRWELWLRRPPAGFAHLVAGLWAGHADTSDSRHRLLPSGEVWLMFNLGPPQRVAEVNGSGPGQVVRTACVSGLFDRPLSFESVQRHPRVVGVRLLPLGAWALFGGLPLLDLANQVVDLEAVLGSAVGVEPLRQRLLEARDLGAGLDLVEDWLIARLITGPSAHPVTQEAWRRLRIVQGDLQVEALSRDLDVSARHLNGLFHRQIGLAAKGLMRILRFEHAQDLLIEAGTSDLAGLANQCGYYDQAHMNRDFRELADLTPTEYRARVFVAPGWREIGG